MNVHMLSSLSHLQKLQRRAGSKMIIVEFFTNWCRPCRYISPHIMLSLKKQSNVLYCRVDMDEGSEISSAYGVVAVPAFLLLRRGGCMAQVVSSRLETVQEKIQSLLNHDCRGVTAKFLYRGEVYCDRCRPKNGQEMGSFSAPSDISD